MNFKDKKILVTGGAGFLGKFVVQELIKSGADPKKITIPRSSKFDLRSAEICKKIVKGKDMVIHLAANVGGIGYNQAHPGRLFYDNAIMGINLIHAAYMAKVKKMIVVGTVCAYPKFTPVPFKEKDLWSGYPEETNAPYGLAKKMLLVQSQAYRQEYSFNCIYLLPVNLYGPHDNFDPSSSHVIPALIKKFVDAKKNDSKSVEIWGTGKASREFLYVEDAAHAIVLALKRYNGSEPINLGSKKEITIRELVSVIASLTGYKGKIVYNPKYPDGQPRRYLDTTLAKKYFGFKAKYSFKKGLQNTINWYLSEF